MPHRICQTMTCFDITIAYPIHERTNVNKSYDKHIDHLRKHYNANLLGTFVQNGEKHLRIALCDLDAANFLRDVPQPTYCIRIHLLRTGKILYTNRKSLWEWTPPPQDPILKKVYWSASQLEKWQTT